MDVLKVQEVVRKQALTAVPLASSLIQGLINLRGEIVTAIDLRQWLSERSELATDDDPMNVVAVTKSGPVSFIVDRVGDVVEVDHDSYEAAPECIDEHIRELVTGVHKLNQQLLLVLDIEKAANIANHR